MRNLLAVLCCLSAIVALLVSGFSSPSEARRSVVLAEDYPYASIFLGMARRGAEDFAARHDTFPTTLAELMAAGYTAYEFPAGFVPSITIDGDKYTVSSDGHQEYTGGYTVDSFDYGATMHHGGLYIERELYIFPHGDAEEEPVLQNVKAYFFRGAEWLDNGADWDIVERGQRFDRLATHLTNASYQYGADNQCMPTDLADLESYVGLVRNPAGWEGVTLVNSPEEVDTAAGNLFIGWEDDKWVIICNLGPEVTRYEFWQLDGGDWTGTGGIIY